MKLEIKHLAPYLPYGLKLQGIKQEIFGIKDAEYEMFKLSKGLNGNLIISGRVRSEMGGTFSIGECEIGKQSEQFLKPILFPLSDLPTDELLPHTFNNSPEDLIERIKTGNAEYWVIRGCFENHFDIFNLIESGLALNKLDYIK